MNILATGGTGYIGSHTCVELLESGHNVVIADNLSNSSRDTLAAIERISGRAPRFHEVDLSDKDALRAVFQKNSFDAVIHFAASKAVAESVSNPLAYYSNNLISTLNLLALMKEYGVYKLVFSSSAAVYGIPETSPVSETCPLKAINPYGQSKVMVEQILTDLVASDKKWAVAMLRYFNPVGGHESGLMGEDLNGAPSNLFPRILQVLRGQLDDISVFGSNYDTRDGTAVRDYVHINDLARGHTLALNKITEAKEGLYTYNLGSGSGYTVLEVLRTMEQIHGKAVAYTLEPRRDGDAPECYADCSLAQRELGYENRHDLEDMCRDAYRWAFNADPNK